MNRPRVRRGPAQGVGLPVSNCQPVDTRAYPRTAMNHSPSLRDPTGAHFSQSSTMPATLCKAMYLLAVMKVPSSRGNCISRSHPTSHAPVTSIGKVQNRSSCPHRFRSWRGDVTAGARLRHHAVARRSRLSRLTKSSTYKKTQEGN
jgi:hypothetical protein